MRISRSHTAKQEPGLNSKPSAHWSTLGCHLLNTVQDRNHAHGLVLPWPCQPSVDACKMPAKSLGKVSLPVKSETGWMLFMEQLHFVQEPSRVDGAQKRLRFLVKCFIKLFPPHRSTEVQPLISGFYVNCCLSTITRYISIFMMEPWWKSDFRKEEIQSVIFNIQGKYNKMILNGKIQVICDPSRPAIYIFKNIRLNISLLKALKVSSRREH